MSSCSFLFSRLTPSRHLLDLLSLNAAASATLANDDDDDVVVVVVVVVEAEMEREKAQN